MKISGEDIMSGRNITILVLVFLILLIIVQNLDIVNLNFLFWTIQINLLLVILLGFLSGFIVGWLSRRIYTKRKSDSIKKETTQ
jgi:uncharacterized integral membrane protein